MNCHWIVSGGLSLIPSGKPTRSIDWGNGSCDDQEKLLLMGMYILLPYIKQTIKSPAIIKYQRAFLFNKYQFLNWKSLIQKN